MEEDGGSFTNWGSGEPSRTGGESQNCMAIRASDGVWYDGPCHLPWHAVCSKPIASAAADTTAATTTATSNSTTTTTTPGIIVAYKVVQGFRVK